MAATSTDDANAFITATGTEARNPGSTDNGNAFHCLFNLL